MLHVAAESAVGRASETLGAILSAMTMRVALVRGPMYDYLYGQLENFDVEIIAYEDHPTLNRLVAQMLAAGERIDLLSTHSKYAPSQAAWLRPLDDLIDTAKLVPLHRCDHVVVGVQLFEMLQACKRMVSFTR